MRKLTRLLFAASMALLLVPATAAVALAQPGQMGGLAGGVARGMAGGPPGTLQARQVHQQQFLHAHSDATGRPRPDLWQKGVAQFQHMKIAAGETRTLHRQGTGGVQTFTAIQGVQWTQIGPQPLNIDAEQNYQGTGPDSGEIEDIAIDPRNATDATIYIATEAGGVWKTTDGGNTWAPLTDYMPSLTMGALALDPGNPSIVYAGTGNPWNGGNRFSKGVGIYKSIDGGQTWSIIGANLFNRQLILRMVTPAPNQLLVATNNGVYRSVDGGAHFGNNVTADNGTPSVGGVIWNLALDTQNPTTTVYATVAGQGVFKSTDDGQTFTNLFTSTNGAPTGSFGVIAFAQSATDSGQTMYASVQDTTANVTPAYKGLFKSTDGGNTWTKMTAANTPAAQDGNAGSGCQCGYDLTVGVDPQDANRVYIGFQELWLSTDGGNSFGGSAVTLTHVHWDHHAITFSPSTHFGGGGAPTKLYVGTDGGIASSGDGGSTWTNLNSDIATNLFYQIDMGRGNATNDGYTYGGTQDTGTIEHTPAMSGTNWHLGIDGDGSPIAVDPTNPQRAYAADDGSWTETTNAGANWGGGGSGLSGCGGNTPFCIGLIAIDPTNSSVVYVAASNVVSASPSTTDWQLWQSTDTGATFTLMHDFGNNGPSISALAVTPLDENVIWVGFSDGTVQRTANALSGSSATWTTVSVTGRPNQGVGGIAIDPGNDQQVTVVYTGFTGADAGGVTQHAFMTTDNGTTWSNISGTEFGSQNLPDLPLQSVVIDPGTTPHAIIVATDAGVMRSADGGATWQVFGVGLPTVDARSLAIDTSVSPAILRIGTYGRSTFELTAATGPLLAVNANLAFGVVPLGQTATRIMQIFNVGSSDLHISSITRAAGSPDFSIVSGPPTPVTVTPGEEIDYTVQFAPTASGDESAYFQINSDDPFHPAYDVYASGAGGAPNIVVGGDLTFGTVARGTSASLDVTIYNTGTSQLAINNVFFQAGSDPDFSVLGPSTPQYLAPGTHMAFTAQFAPPANSTGGTRTGTLEIDSNDPINGVETVAATGVVGVPQIAIANGAITFASVAVDDRTTPFSNDQTLSITNQASCPLCDLTITSLPFSGPNAGDFTLIGAPSLPAVIGAGNTLNLTLRYNPSAGGARSATLTVNSNDPAQPSIAVSLGGTGLLPAINGVPSTIIFGPTVYSPLCGTTCGQSQTETISDTGQAELLLDLIATMGDPSFSVPSATNPVTRVQPGSSFGAVVSFMPTGGPSRALRGTLTVEDTVNGEVAPITMTIPLCGESTGRGIRVLVYDTSGNLVTTVSKLSLQSHGLTKPVNIQLKNLSLVTISPPTSCQTIQYQYENQKLQVAGYAGNRGAYYTLSVSVGNKHATISFTLNVADFKTLSVVVQ